MQTNSDGSTILIENPRTGSESFGRALGLAHDTRFPRWATPNEVRGDIPGWRDAKKIVLVRSPFVRFISGAQLALFYLEQSLVGMPVDFVGVLESVKDAAPLSRGHAILDFIREGGEVPTFLKPQTEWVNCKVDLVVASHDIAQYFNTNKRGCCLRSNAYTELDGWRGRRVTTSLERLELAYADDYDLFSRLSLWSPDPSRVRLLEGFCSSCPRKVAPEHEMITASELGDEEPDLHERANVPKGRKAKATKGSDVLVDKMLRLSEEEGLVGEASLLVHLATQGQQGLSLAELASQIPGPTEIDTRAIRE